MRFQILCTIAGLIAASLASAAEVAPDDVQFDEYGAVATSVSGASGDADAGYEVFAGKGDGNCIACHSVTALIDTVPFHGNVGPSLDGVADRWDETQLRGIVANAKGTYDGTIMPSFYKASGYIRPGVDYTSKPATEPLPPILTAQQIEDLVAYLMTLKE